MSPNPGTGFDGLASVSALSANDVWAVGSSNPGALTEHWNGINWQIVPNPDSNTFAATLAAVAAVASNNVWAAGNQGSDTLIEHWNGTQWTVAPSPNMPGSNQLHGLAVLTANDIWAVGDTYPPSGTEQTLTMHWNGTNWQVVPSPSPGGASTDNELHGVAANGPDDVWTVGGLYGYNGSEQILIEHWDGHSWQTVSGPNTSTNGILWGLAVIGGNDAWTVGFGDAGALIEHWDGALWSVISLPTPPPHGLLTALAVVSPQDLWAVGYYVPGTDSATLALHWDGAAWTQSSTPNAPAGRSLLSGVAATGAGTIWAVGSGGPDNGTEPLIEVYGALCVTPSPTASPRPTATPMPPSATPTPCTPGQFSDVHPADYFYTPVQYLVSRGVISGYGDCTFRPYANTTRAQQVKIVALGFALPSYTPGAGGKTFADVAPTFPFFNFVETAAHAGVVSGYACGGSGEPCDVQHRPYFRPYNNVTRGQLAKIITVAADWVQINPASATFADIAPGSAFYTVVETATCHGAISGYACGGAGEPCDAQHRPYFRQYNNATRGQIAKIIYLGLTGSTNCRQPTVGPR